MKDTSLDTFTVRSIYFWLSDFWSPNFLVSDFRGIFQLAPTLFESRDCITSWGFSQL